MAHRYRIYPNQDEAESFARHCNDTRFIWNLALEQFNFYDRRVAGRKAPSVGERQRQLADLRKVSWLGEGASAVQQPVLRDFKQACENWWRGTHRRPTWRKAGRSEGFCIRDVTVKVINGKWATVHVPKCGHVRFRLSRRLPEQYGMGRVTCDAAGRWHVASSAPQPKLLHVTSGRAVGIDLGIASTITTSDAAHYDAPTPEDGEKARLLRLERQFARQTKGSNRRGRTRGQIAKLKVRQADRLKDWREKITTELVVNNDLIVVEDLRVKNMLRSAKGTAEAPGKNVKAKSGLNREIAARGWSAFTLRLEQKAAASGVEFIKVSAKNTSRKCRKCGHTDKDNRKSQAVFRCIKCGHQTNADINAAKNILAAGQAVSGRGGTVRPVAALAAAGKPVETSTTGSVLCAA